MKNLQNEQDPTAGQQVVGSISPKSYDADTPKVYDREGKAFSVRIRGTDGTEKGSGNDAEFFQKGLYSIFGEDKGNMDTVVSYNGKDPWGRLLGNLETKGVDWRHLIYEAGVSNNWTNYGFDEKGSEADERSKWYAGNSQTRNLEAYKLLEEAPEPSEILDDQTFYKIELLNKSMMSHIADANDGVLDKEDAKKVILELMSDPDVLAVAQKRRWYEAAISSNVAEIMLANWNDPYSRAALERNQRVKGVDAVARVDTSFSAITSNAFKQQFGDINRYKYGKQSGSHRDGTYQHTFSEDDIHNYIANEEIDLDVAAKALDIFEKQGGTAAMEALESGMTQRESGNISFKVDKAIEREKSVKNVAKFFWKEAAPYAVDPTTYLAGGGAGAVAKQGAKLAFQKVSSPLVRRALESTAIGAATGFGESVAYTSNNYKDFTNAELQRIWATDAGMGGALGAIFSLAKTGVSAYGKRAKEGSLDEIDDLNYVVEDSFKEVVEKDMNQSMKMQAEVAKDLKNGVPDIVEHVGVAVPNYANYDKPTVQRVLSETSQRISDRVQRADEAANKVAEGTDVVSKAKAAGERQRVRSKELETGKFDTDEAIVDAVKQLVGTRKPRKPVAPKEFVGRTNEKVTRARSSMDAVPEGTDVASKVEAARQREIVRDYELSRSQFDDPEYIRSRIKQLRKDRKQDLPSTPAKDTVKTDETNVTKVDDEEATEITEDLIQEANVAETLLNHMEKVKPKVDAARSKAKRWNILAKAHGLLAERELATRLIKSNDAKVSFVGTNILETGIGFTGKLRRKHSAALIKDSIYTKNVGNLNRSYVDNIKGYALEGGASKYKAFKAAWEGGKVNDVAKQFHREVFRHQEMLQMGKKPESSKFVQEYVNQLNAVNEELFEGRIRSKIKGFDTERRISNYVPHVWKKVRVKAISDKFGSKAIKDLLRESLESAQRAGKFGTDVDLDEAVTKQYEWITGLGDSVEHIESKGAGVSARGKSRLPLDFTVEKNGISMLDLVDTDIPTVMDSYIQRAGADIGISDSTNGLIRSEGDFEKFLTPTDANDAQLITDVKDMLYGRPTRGGVSPEVRNLMDLTTLQQMGGIGVAQLAETGTMMQRTLVNYISQPEIGKKIWKLAGEDINDKGVLHQIRSISAVNDNMEFINRYSVNNIDQAQIDELSNFRAASMDAVDKATLGAYKAQFGRLLGSLSGVNAVQKAQSRLLQASFSVDVARHFKFGKGTSSTARLADLGLSSKSGDAIKQHVKFDADGFPENFNFDKWDKQALDEFVHAMNREEAQLMPRVMSGELPEFMNKPLWQVIMQFRKTPLAFMSKGTQRNLQFADREAILGTVLNTATAGVVRYGKVALGYGAYTAITKAEWDNGELVERASGQAQTYNYVSNNGILGDAYTIGKQWWNIAQNKDGIEALWEGAQQVSTVSSLDAAYGAIQGDPADIKKTVPLNTLIGINEVTNALIKKLEEE